MNSLKDWLSRKSFSRIIFLVDDNSSTHCLPIIKNDIQNYYGQIIIPHGENSKNLKTAETIWKQLLEMEADRNALLINLGGGMITDIGGFCAATYKRGISFINIPTTLLAMVDAAIGNKTGINIGHYKNQVGLFAKPDQILIDPIFLKTLPERELVAGFAEVLKYGLISNYEFWKDLKDSNPKDIADWQSIIDTCVIMKKDIVKADPKEKGIRKILNYGHTFGHALESYSLENDAKPLLHGEAVAIGMVAEAWLSYEKTGLSAHELDEISTSIQTIFKIEKVKRPDLDMVYEYMLKDKKNKDNEVRFVLLKKVGEPVYDIKCSYEEMTRAYDYYQSTIVNTK